MLLSAAVSSLSHLSFSELSGADLDGSYGRHITAGMLFELPQAALISDVSRFRRLCTSLQPNGNICFESFRVKYCAVVRFPSLGNQFARF